MKKTIRVIKHFEVEYSDEKDLERAISLCVNELHKKKVTVNNLLTSFTITDLNKQYFLDIID